MGLNDSYLQARSQILITTPFSSVNHAYSMLMSDESQKKMSASTSVLGASPISYGGHSESIVMYSSKPGIPKKFKKMNSLICDYCKLKNHTKKNYYKLVCYPSNKFKMKGVGSGSKAYNVITNSQVSEHQGSGQSVLQAPVESQIILPMLCRPLV